MTKNITTTFSEEEIIGIIESAVAKAISNIPEKQKTEIIDRAELCRRLNITEPTTIRWEKKGVIPSFRIGSNVRYNWPVVTDALQQKRKGGNA